MVEALSRLAVIGAGGNSREIRSLVDDINGVRPRYEFAGYVVSDPEAPGEHDDIENTVGSLDDLYAGRLAVDAVSIGVADPAIRYSLGTKLVDEHPAISLPRLVHPSAHIDRASCKLGVGTILSAGVIVTVNVVIGDFAMINRATNLGHEASVGRGVTINPLASISGGVRIGDRTLVGTSAVVLQYVSIGSDAVVGAGAVVTRDVADGTTVIGVPARALGE